MFEKFEIVCDSLRGQVQPCSPIRLVRSGQPTGSPIWPVRELSSGGGGVRNTIHIITPVKHARRPNTAHGCICFEACALHRRGSISFCIFSETSENPTLQLQHPAPSHIPADHMALAEPASPAAPIVGVAKGVRCVSHALAADRGSQRGRGTGC